MDRSVRERVFKRAHYMCEYEGCNERATEIAHKIANTKANVKWIKRILLEEKKLEATDAYVKKKFIDNANNLAASCKKHNDYFNCGFNNAEAYKIIKKCKEDL